LYAVVWKKITGMVDHDGRSIKEFFLPADIAISIPESSRAMKNRRPRWGGRRADQGRPSDSLTS
jgi:hypothetical protein